MLLQLALACTGSPPGDDSGPRGDPTDTFPSFYGRVPRNLLVVSIDTTRRDLFSRYGDTVYAPFLESLMESGVTLDRHRSCSNWTMPSVLCAQSGMTNIDLGMVPDLRDTGESMAPKGMRTLATRLYDAGYYTQLVTSNSWFSADHLTDQGFEVSIRPDDRRTMGIFAESLDQLAQARSEGRIPWYAHMHVKEPHPSYDPPDEYLADLEGLDPIDWDLTKSDDQYAADAQYDSMSTEEQELLLAHLRIRYHGEVRWLDDQLTDAFADLELYDLLDDTLVLFWVDHGEQFWEHGDQTHAYNLNAEENDTIAFFWAKNIVPGSWDEATSHIDLAPTVLNLLSVDDTEGMTGIPVGQADPDRTLDFLSAARLGVVQSVVKDDWKLIYRWGTGERRLYDTRNDPHEETDLYSAEEPHAKELEVALQERVKAMEPLTDYTPN